MKIAIYGSDRTLISGRELHALAEEIEKGRKCFLSYWGGSNPFCDDPRNEDDKICLLCKRLTPLREEYLVSDEWCAILKERAKQQLGSI